jgi:membrane dipeptidase
MIKEERQEIFYDMMRWYIEKINYPLVEEVGRVTSREIKLTKREEDEVNKILEKYVKISLHDHTLVYPKQPGKILDYVKDGRWWIGFKGLSASKLDAVFEGLFDGIATIRSPDPWSWDNIIHQIGIFRTLVSKNEDALIAQRPEDIIRAHDENMIAFILHLEGAPRVGEDMIKIEILYGLGVRCIGITYSKGNEFGSGLADKNDRGLTDLGHDLVKKLDEIGIAIDIAHVGDKTSLDTIEASKNPIFISHAGARSVWPTKRMKPDEVIQAMAEKGGVIGIEAAPHTTISKNNTVHSIESIMDHFKYIEKLVGIDHVAFGPDTLFGDHVALHKIFMEYLSISPRREVTHPKVKYVDGLENPSQYINIIRWLVKNGYSENEISKVIGKNIMRVLNRVW